MKWEEEIEEQIKERAEKYAEAFEAHGVAEASFIRGAEFGYNKTMEKFEKQIADLEWQLQEVAKDNDNYQKENKRLEEQLEKMKNRKVFLLQIIDADDYTIDRRFYTTDEEIAKEWDKYDKYNCCYGRAIELEELSDKERIREELND